MNESLGHLGQQLALDYEQLHHSWTNLFLDQPDWSIDFCSSYFDAIEDINAFQLQLVDFLQKEESLAVGMQTEKHIPKHDPIMSDRSSKELQHTHQNNIYNQSQRIFNPFRSVKRSESNPFNQPLRKNNFESPDQPNSSTEHPTIQKKGLTPFQNNAPTPNPLTPPSSDSNWFLNNELAQPLEHSAISVDDGESNKRVATDHFPQDPNDDLNTASPFQSEKETPKDSLGRILPPQSPMLNPSPNIEYQDNIPDKKESSVNNFIRSSQSSKLFKQQKAASAESNNDTGDNIIGNPPLKPIKSFADLAKAVHTAQKKEVPSEDWDQKSDNIPEKQSGPSKPSPIKKETKSIDTFDAFAEDTTKNHWQAQPSKDITKEQAINHPELYDQNKQLTSSENDLVNRSNAEDFTELLDDLKKHLNTEYKRFYE